MKEKRIIQPLLGLFSSCFCCFHHLFSRHLVGPEERRVLFIHHPLYSLPFSLSMVQAWFYNSASDEDQRAPHQTTPVHYISLAFLSSLGVDYWRLPTDGALENPHGGKLGEIRKQREYSSHDIVTISRDKLPNYDEKLRMFFEEHIHEDEEIRFCLAGSGYFDIRNDIDGNWIRIQVVAGDLIVLPPGMYHRFTLDMGNFIQVIRLFKENPKWEAINRGERADQTKARNDYLEKVKTAGKSASAASASQSINGTGFILHEGAQSIANYPHLRAHGGLLYVSGISSRRADNTHEGAVQNPDGSWDLDIAKQTRAVLTNIQTILAMAGAGLSNVLNCTVYLSDMKYYAEYNKVYNEFFPTPALAPTRTTVAVKQLPHPNLLIEIQTVAVDTRKEK